MAILKSYDSRYGVVFPEAYWMISRVDITRLDRQIATLVDIFTSQDSRNSGSEPIDKFFFTVADADYDAVIAGGIPALYEALKKEPAVEGGVDA